MRVRATVLFCVLGLSCWQATAACSQRALGGTLPEPLRDHVENDRFQIVTSIRGLPLGVRDELERMFRNGLDIAEPGAPFQASDVVVDPNLPSRRLVAAGCSQDHCLVYYERGGIAHRWLVALFHWMPSATRFEFGGLAPGGLKTIEEVRKAVLSGAIKPADSADVW